MGSAVVVAAVADAVDMVIAVAVAQLRVAVVLLLVVSFYPPADKVDDSHLVLVWVHP